MAKKNQWNEKLAKEFAFSTKEAAEIYKIENKHCLSLKDIGKICTDIGIGFLNRDNHIKQSLISLIKSRL